MSSTFTAGFASTYDSFANPAPPPPAAGDPPGPLLFYFVLVTYDGAASFKLSQISAADPAPRPAAGSLPLALPFEQRALATGTASGPTAATVLQARPLPGGIVRVEATVNGVARPIEDFDLSVQLNVGQVALGLRHDAPPRLALAINTTFVAKPPAGSFAKPDAAAIRTILEHIHARLLDGLDAAWLGSDGVPGWGYTGAAPSEEDRWARAITEMLLVSPYGVPSTLYSDPALGERKALDDGEVLARYFDPVDPIHSIGFECQHLVTMAAMTRGLVTTTKKVKNKFKDEIVVISEQFTAGRGSLGVVTRLGGRITGDTTIPPLFEPKPDLKPTELTPGSSWVYDGKGGPNTGAAHIGFALRVDATHRRAQTFDTGGLNVTGRDVALISDGGSFDDPWCPPHIDGPKGGVFKGVCLLPAPTALGAAVDHMAKVRPLGFARLVLMSRAVVAAHRAAKAPAALTRDDILFATPLLRMHHGDRNLRLATYLWSLREHPGAADIVAIWMIYTPRGALARVAMFGDPAHPGAGARELSLAQLVALAKLKTDDKPPKDLTSDHTLGGSRAFSVEDQESQPDGTVQVTRRWDQHHDNRKGGDHAAMFDQLPWGTTVGSVAGVDLSGLPYFRDG